MTGTGPFSANIIWLDSVGTTYHYRAKAVGDGDPVYGSDMVASLPPPSIGDHQNCQQHHHQLRPAQRQSELLWARQPASRCPSLGHQLRGLAYPN